MRKLELYVPEQRILGTSSLQVEQKLKGVSNKKYGRMNHSHHKEAYSLLNLLCHRLDICIDPPGKKNSNKDFEPYSGQGL